MKNDLYKKINNRRYKKITEFDFVDNFSSPANGFCLVNGNGWTIIDVPNDITDKIQYVELMSVQNDFISQISKLEINGYTPETIKKISESLYEIVITKKFENCCYKNRDRFSDTTYKKVGNKYYIHGLVDGFQGFEKSGIYFINIHDGATNEECVTLLKEIKHFNIEKYKNYFRNFKCMEMTEKIQNILNGYRESKKWFSLLSFGSDILFELYKIVNNNEEKLRSCKQE